MSKIIKNKIQCVHCNDIIESTHRHDFKWCSCKTVAVDGGHDYFKRSFKSIDDYIDLSIYEEDEEDILKMDNIMNNDKTPIMYKVYIELITTKDVEEFTEICKSIDEPVTLRGRDEYGEEWSLNAKSFLGNLSMTAIVRDKEQQKKIDTAHSIDWNTIYVESTRDIYSLLSKFAR